MFFRETKRDCKEEIVEKIICEKYNTYYRMAYSYVRNEADAEDIVQEGAYKAIKNSDSLQQKEYAETWIYRIMMNEIYRHTSARKPIPLEEVQMAEFETTDSYEDVDLQDALKAMNDIDRTIIQMKYFDDLKLQDIADILKMPVNSVKTRLYRGLKKLRIELEKE